MNPGCHDSRGPWNWERGRSPHNKQGSPTRHRGLLGSADGWSLPLRVVHGLPAPHRQSAAAMFLDPGGKASFNGNPGVPQGDSSVFGDLGVCKPQIRRETKLSSNAHQRWGSPLPSFHASDGSSEVFWFSYRYRFLKGFAKPAFPNEICFIRKIFNCFPSLLFRFRKKTLPSVHHHKAELALARVRLC